MILHFNKTNNIDGSILSTLTTKELIHTKFIEIGITNEDHLFKLTLLLLGTHINSAVIFIKPQSNNEKIQNLVKETLINKGFNITTEDIDKKRLIDNHYYSIASKATLLQPCDLPVPNDKFETFFKISYKEALEEGSVYNAMQACEYLELDAVELEKVWYV